MSTQKITSLSLALMILVSFCLPSFGQNVNLNLRGVTIKKAITEIQKVSGKSIIVESDGLDLDKTVNVSSADKDIATLIEELFSQTGQDVSVTKSQNSIEVSRDTCKLPWHNVT